MCVWQAITIFYIPSNSFDVQIKLLTLASHLFGVISSMCTFISVLVFDMVCLSAGV